MQANVSNMDALRAIASLSNFAQRDDFMIENVQLTALGEQLRGAALEYRQASDALRRANRCLERRVPPPRALVIPYPAPDKHPIKELLFNDDELRMTGVWLGQSATFCNCLSSPILREAIANAQGPEARRKLESLIRVARRFEKERTTTAASLQYDFEQLCHEVEEKRKKVAEIVTLIRSAPANGLTGLKIKANAHIEENRITPGGADLLQSHVKAARYDELLMAILQMGQG